MFGNGEFSPVVVRQSGWVNVGFVLSRLVLFWQLRRVRLSLGLVRYDLSCLGQLGRVMAVMVGQARFRIG